MRKALSIALVLVLGLSASAFAKPVDVSKSLDKFQYLDLSGGATSDYIKGVADGVLGTSAHAGTTYYGGTAWSAARGRWESLNDVGGGGGLWTFDTGVGSTIMDITETGADYAGLVGNAAPQVNPYKAGGLHALMEGWIGFDNSYSELKYMRRLSSADARWASGAGGQINVGSGHEGTTNLSAAGLLSGSWSYYCGVFKQEADTLCYVGGPGYGNSWFICMGQEFTSSGGVINLSFNMVHETEIDFDFVQVEVDTNGTAFDGGVVIAAQYDNEGAQAHALTLTPGLETRGDAGPVQIRFCFSSDGAWSDEDGLNPTLAGAFAIDDIDVSGAAGNTGVQNFEGGDGGWLKLDPEPGAGGEWSRLALFTDLPAPLTPCECALTDSVLVFEDLVAGGHGELQDNLAASPWIMLDTSDPAHAGPGKFIQTSIYAELPLINYMFVQFNVQWFPDKCEVTGLDLVSPWTSNGFVYYFGGVPQCTAPNTAGTKINFGAFIPPFATEIRISIGIISYCTFFANCSQQSNHTPVFDNVGLGVFGQLGAPLIASRTVDQPQDNFPANGTLRVDAPGRFDSGNVINDSQPEINTSIGDTCNVQGGEGGASVYVEFAVTPGPFVNGTNLTAFYDRLTFTHAKDGLNFYRARMDTSELGGTATPGSYMTAYHEADPNRVAVSDTAKDAGDVTGVGRLANDIFPDDLFTPGTRIDLFYHTKFDTGSIIFLLPDTAGGTYIEWECLPSSVSAADSTWNCVLYVDHFDGRGAQPFVETGLAAVLPGTGNNAEGTTWDRWDVEAPSSQQVSFGRPLGTEYGATVIQALGYDAIVWNSGNLGAFNVVKEDADILIPYLTLLDFAGNSLWISGDGAAHSMTTESASEPSAFLLLTTVMGAQRLTGCNTYRDAGCPTGGAPEDTAACVFLDPVAGVPSATTGALPRTADHRGQGNGCPQQRSFDVLGTFTMTTGGTSAGDESYTSPLKTADYVSIAADAAGGGTNPTYRTLIDGVSVHYRREDGNPCAFASSSNAVTERVNEALTYLGQGGGATTCSDPTASTSTEPPVRPTYRTTLANFAPNPLLAGAKGRITFTMAKEGPANIDIFDVNGRLVKTVFDGIAKEGVNEAFWNGTDFTGRDVASGVYFYRLQAASTDFSKKMVVVRNGGN